MILRWLNKRKEFNQKEKALLEALRQQVNGLTEILTFPSTTIVDYALRYSYIWSDAYGPDARIGTSERKTLADKVNNHKDAILFIDEKIDALADALGYEFEANPKKKKNFICKKKRSPKK